MNTIPPSARTSKQTERHLHICGPYDSVVQFSDLEIWLWCDDQDLDSFSDLLIAARAKHRRIVARGFSPQYVLRGAKEGEAAVDPRKRKRKANECSLTPARVTG